MCDVQLDMTLSSSFVYATCFAVSTEFQLHDCNFDSFQATRSMEWSNDSTVNFTVNEQLALNEQLAVNEKIVVEEIVVDEKNC